MSLLHPVYTVESYFRGDTESGTGRECHFRRYVVEIFLENSTATSGSLKLCHKAGVLYYLGAVPIEGVELTVNDETRRKSVVGSYPIPKENPDGDPYYGYEIFQTDSVTVNWKADSASTERRKIAQLMFCLSRWAMEYTEISSRPEEEILCVDAEFCAVAGDAEAVVSKPKYLGGVPINRTEPTPVFTEVEDEGALLSRFAVMSDAHIGLRYEWKNYDWLYEAFNNMERIHREKPLDFCVQIGDNIDDGYADTYKVDYDIYLEEIKHLNLCDPESPLAPRSPDKIPHYEIQGNHDTSLDTRFFRNKLWFTENAQGQKVAYISFWASYGGYPLLNFVIGDGFNSYRSYGVLSDETVQFVEECVLKAQAENAKQIVLFSHFGISQMLGAPILPESGLGKIANLCKKYGIKLLFNGHEHTGSFPHRMFEEIHDFDVSMLRDKYAIVEIREKVATVIVYNTDDSTVYTTYRVNL